MTAEQIKKIRWLNRVKRAERIAGVYADIYWGIREKVRSMEKQYRAGSSSVKRNAIEAKIIEMLEAERQMNEKAEEAERITEEVHKAIHAIPDELFVFLLNARYMLFYTQEKTAEMLDVSTKTVERLHKQALDMLVIVG